MIYSWQEKTWGNLSSRQTTLPHALLLRGRAGIGKHDFALEFARYLLCNNKEHTKSCGACPSCLWFEEGAHPDFRLISPEDEDTSEDSPKKKTKKKTQISIEQIRQLGDYLSLSTHQASGKRVVLISPAEALNAASANALLKMLEEPPASTLFLLVASEPQRLLPTILSRCQAIDMQVPTKAEAIAWLKAQGLNQAEEALDYASGAPLLALSQQAQLDTSGILIKQLTLGARLDPYSTAPLFLSLGMERAIDVLQKWIFDLINYVFSQQTHFHKQQMNALQGLSKSVKLSTLMRFQQTLIAVKKTATHPLSNEMQLENILLQYVAIFK